MKLKKLKKEYLQPTEVSGFFKKIKLTWGHLSLYICQKKNGKYNYSLYWTDTDTGSDNTLAMLKNKTFDNTDEIVHHALCIAESYFEDMKMRHKIEGSIGDIQKLRQTL